MNISGMYKKRQKYKTSDMIVVMWTEKNQWMYAPSLSVLITIKNWEFLLSVRERWGRRDCARLESSYERAWSAPHWWCWTAASGADPGASTEEQDPEEGRREKREGRGERDQFRNYSIYHTSIKLCTQTNNNSCIHTGVNIPPPSNIGHRPSPDATNNYHQI